MSNLLVNGQPAHLTPKGIKVGKTFIGNADRLAKVLSGEVKGVRRAVLRSLHRDGKGSLATETYKGLRAA